MSIGVILTSHRRPHTLRPQLEAIRRQSVTPNVVCVWHNGSPEQNGTPVPVTEMKCADEHVYCSNNRGVWGRFLYGLELGTEYVAVFDDDTIPGHRWLESCLNIQKQRPAVCGTNGVVFQDGTRGSRRYVGIGSQNNEPEEVDIVGHSWVFPTSLLHSFAHLSRPTSNQCGEDYMLSVAAQVRHGWPTVVPPHPANDMSQWGSIQAELGTDDKALYHQPEADEIKQAAHDHYLSLGWKPLALRTSPSLTTSETT